jgi:acyl-CoA hydrolase
MQGKPVSASLTTLADLTNPPNANIHGTVFGGFVLALVDKAAAVCAMRHAGAAVVTVAMDRVEFLVPIRVGSLISVKACMNYAGKSSMEIGVEVYSEDIVSGERRNTNSCLVTMVAVDQNGKPTQVPPLLPQSPEEKERFKAAEERRLVRLSRRRA